MQACLEALGDAPPPDTLACVAQARRCARNCRRKCGERLWGKQKDDHQGYTVDPRQPYKPLGIFLLIFLLGGKPFTFSGQWTDGSGIFISITSTLRTPPNSGSFLFLLWPVLTGVLCQDRWVSSVKRMQAAASGCVQFQVFPLSMIPPARWFSLFWWGKI